MRKLLLSVCFSLLLAVPSLSFAQGASKESVKQLLIVSGGLDAGMEPMNAALEDFKRMKLSRAKITAIEKEFGVDKFIDVIVPVYQKHFTEQEIQDLIKFYQTSVGRKLLSNGDTLSREAEVAGEKWGQELLVKIEKILSQ